MECQGDPFVDNPRLDVWVLAARFKLNLGIFFQRSMADTGTAPHFYGTCCSCGRCLISWKPWSVQERLRRFYAQQPSSSDHYIIGATSSYHTRVLERAIKNSAWLSCFLPGPSIEQNHTIQVGLVGWNSSYVISGFCVQVGKTRNYILHRTMT